MITVEDYQCRLGLLLAKPFYSAADSSLGFPPGWLAVIERMVTGLEALEGGSTLRCVQQKEKFGTLRCYLLGAKMRIDFLDIGLSLRPPEADTLLEAAHAVIREAELATRDICYVCGEAGTLRRDGWALVLCDEHDAMRRQILPESQPIPGSRFRIHDRFDQVLYPYHLARRRLRSDGA